MKPDHFYSIIKYEKVFLVVDDLKKTCPEFDCFSGAMTGNHQLMQDHYITSNKQNGIHILIYSLSNRKEQETLLLELQTTEQLKQYTYTSNLLYAEAEDNLISSVPTSDSDKSKQKEKHQTEQIENINNGNPLPSGLVVNVEGDASVPTSNSHKTQQKEKHQTEQIENINNGNSGPVDNDKDACNATKATTRKTLTAAKRLLEQLRSQHMQDHITCISDNLSEGLMTSENLCVDTPEAATYQQEESIKVLNTHTEPPNKDKDFTLSQEPKSKISQLECGIENNTCSLLGKSFICKIQDGKSFLPCKPTCIFEFSGLKVHIKKEGYKLVDRRLVTNGFGLNEHFLFCEKSNMRNFISVEALICIIQGRFKLAVNGKHLLQDLDTFINNRTDRIYKKTGIVNPANMSPTGIISLDGKDIEYKVLGSDQEKEVSLSCAKIFGTIDMNKSIKKWIQVC